MDILAAGAQGGLWRALLNSLAIALPATVIPIAIAAFAAYAFAWIDFKGQERLFIATVSLLAIPAQMSLIPLLQLYSGGGHLTIPLLDKTLTLFPDLDLAGSMFRSGSPTPASRCRSPSSSSTTTSAGCPRTSSSRRS